MLRTSNRSHAWYCILAQLTADCVKVRCLCHILNTEHALFEGFHGTRRRDLFSKSATNLPVLRKEYIALRFVLAKRFFLQRLVGRFETLEECEKAYDELLGKTGKVSPEQKSRLRSAKERFAAFLPMASDSAFIVFTAVADGYI